MPFLDFTSYSSGLTGWWKNTPEYLSATMTLAEVSVPEPGTVLLVGLGLLALVGYKKRNALPLSSLSD